MSHALTDSVTMLSRNLRHSLRNPTMLYGSLMFPIIMLLMFVYVLGGAFRVGVDYLDYVVPGVIIMSVGYGAGMTVVGVSYDMTQGIIARFRTMAISRASVLTGHVVGSVIRTLGSITVIFGVTMVMGFRPSASPGAWLAAIGVVVLITVAVSWLTVAFALLAKTPEEASFYSFPLTFLPFISSAFAPPGTMPAGVRWFTDNQPFTPVIETLRGLLTGTPIGDSGWLAVTWSVGLALIGYAWAKSRFRKVR
jgi:ABC-2 type transport system permease protein